MQRIMPKAATDYNCALLTTAIAGKFMDNVIVWIIIAAFYAPLHFIPPILLVVFKSPVEQRRSSMMHSAIDCAVSMLLAFGLVFYFGVDQIMLAMVILLLALLLPYIRVVRVLLQSRSTESAD